MIMKRNPVVASLAALPGLADLPKRELKALARSGREIAHEAGRELIKEGAGKAALHLILDGTARIEAAGKVLNTLGPGDFVGEMAFLNDASRSASVVAESAVRTFAVAAWSFDALMDQAPTLAARLRQDAVARRPDDAATD